MEIIPRLFDKVEFKEDCWVWTKYVNSYGYGTIKINRKTEFTHRVSYKLFVGSIPKGLELDHLCSNPACLNPDHLEAVTHAENVRRSKVKGSTYLRKVRGDDEAWCTKCQDFLLKEDFHKNKNRWNGLCQDCMECKSKAGKKYHEKNRESTLKKQRARYRKKKQNEIDESRNEE